MEKVMNKRKKEDRDLSGKISEQEEEGRSQSLGSQVREEHAMNNDVEALHSQGDEPDLVKYLKKRKEE